MREFGIQRDHLGVLLATEADCPLGRVELSAQSANQYHFLIGNNYLDFETPLGATRNQCQAAKNWQESSTL
jgi:hypothetical protein